MCANDRPVLVIGYGNELRGDDAAGPIVARRIADAMLPDVRALAVPQLLPELAAEITGARLAIFVDAALPAYGECVRVTPVAAGQHAPLGHTGGPEWLLALAQFAFGMAPEGVLVSIPATDFTIGAEPAAAVCEAIETAVQAVHRLVQERRSPP